MRWRYISFSLLITLIHIFCWLFVMNFCAVYVNSNKEWVIGSIISLSIQLFAIKIIGCLILSSFRTLAKRFYTVKFVLRTYSFLNFIFKYVL